MAKKKTTKKKIAKKKTTKKKPAAKKTTLVSIGDEKIVPPDPKIFDLVNSGSPTVLQKDSRLLRERLVWVFKRVPLDVQKQIDLTLKQFAMNVSKYCEHPETVFIGAEGKMACIDCGARLPLSKSMQKRLELMKPHRV